MVTRYTTLVLLALVTVLWTGCSQQTINSANKDASHDISVAGNVVKKIGDEVKPAVKKLDAEAKPQVDKLDLGARVTAALQSNANLPHTIRVDADTTGVRLRGTVNDAHQKALAGKVAQQTLPAGKTVSNELTVKA